MAHLTLREIKLKLEIGFEGLNFHVVQVTNNAGLHTLSQLNSLRQSLNILYETGLFNDEIEEIMHLSFYKSTTDTIAVTTAELNTLRSNTEHIKVVSEGMIHALNIVVPNEEQYSINFKMPKDVNDFTSLASVCISIDKVLDQLIINETIKGEKRIMSVENGSIWFNLFVGEFASRLIGKVAWASAVIFNKASEVRANQEFNRGLKMKNEAIEEMVKIHKVYIDKLITAEAELISNDEFKDSKDKHEETQRIKLAIIEFSDLIFRGAEIRPAINAPEQVSNLFPNYSKLIGTQSKIKEIDKPL
jgi:hypothetical protein